MTTALSAGPKITMRLRGDGTGEVVVNGVAKPIAADALHGARAQGLAQVQLVAARGGAPVPFTSFDPEGEWELVMHPDGQVSEFDSTSPVVTDSQPIPAEVEATEPAATHSDLPVAPPDAPPDAPAESVPARRAYDSAYVMSSIIPVTRIPRSTRGWRGFLGIGPGKRELAERTDRAAASQTYGRPVTIMVADPRGGSGKTTTSLLLAGAFGVARGGGVLALENHELRGTMHLRTNAEASTTTIRDMLSVSTAEKALHQLRLGDLAAYVRHQIAGQYDVLVSATKSDRALAREEFDGVHDLVSRFYQIIIVDTANNESAENWKAATEKADALVVPVKWRNDYSMPAIEMLEELQHSKDERMQSLVRRAVIVASHGQGDMDPRCRQHLKPYFTDRTQAVIEIAPDGHIAEGNVIQHDQLKPATRRQAERVAAEVAEAIRLGL